MALSAFFADNTLSFLYLMAFYVTGHAMLKVSFYEDLPSEVLLNWITWHQCVSLSWEFSLILGIF